MPVFENWETLPVKRSLVRGRKISAPGLRCVGKVARRTKSPVLFIDEEVLKAGEEPHDREISKIKNNYLDIKNSQACFYKILLKKNHKKGKISEK